MEGIPYLQKTQMGGGGGPISAGNLDEGGWNPISAGSLECGGIPYLHKNLDC